MCSLPGGVKPRAGAATSESIGQSKAWRVIINCEIDFDCSFIWTSVKIVQEVVWVNIFILEAFFYYYYYWALLVFSELKSVRCLHKAAHCCLCLSSTFFSSNELSIDLSDTFQTGPKLTGCPPATTKTEWLKDGKSPNYTTLRPACAKHAVMGLQEPGGAPAVSHVLITNMVIILGLAPTGYYSLTSRWATLLATTIKVIHRCKK